MKNCFGWKFNLVHCIRLLAFTLAFLTAPMANASVPPNFDGDYSAIITAIKNGKRAPIDFTRTIAPGVTHRFQYLPDKPWTINTVEMKFEKAPGPGALLQITAEAGNDKLYQGERTTRMAEREARDGNTVVCAINADFYEPTHRPVGLFVDDGHIFKNPHSIRPVFAVGKSGRFYITETTLLVSITIGDKQYNVEDVNPMSSGGNGAIFTHKNNRPIPYDPEFAWYRLTVQGETFLPNEAASFKFAGALEANQNFSVSEGEFVVSVKLNGELAVALASLKPGDNVTIQPTLPAFPEPITVAVGGIPRLISDGKIDVAWKKAGIGENFSTTEHPRTAVGFSQDFRTLWFVTVDGRQPGLSRGISLPDLAQFMLDLGCWQAMNLDGGGSTTMVVRDQIMNSPSDTRERSVSNSLMLVMNLNTASGARKYSPVIYPQNVLLPTGSKTKFRAELIDDLFNPVPVKGAKFEFKADGDIGRMDGFTLNAADKSAKGTVSVTSTASGAKTVSTSVEVAAIDKIEFHPRHVLLRTGEEGDFSYRITTSDGRKFHIDDSSITVKYPDFIRPLTSKQGVAGIRSGKGQIEVSIGAKKASILAAVDEFNQQIVLTFDKLPESVSGGSLFDGRLYKEDLTKVAIVTDAKREGTGALKWDYGMLSGGTTTIHLNLKSPIPGDPLRLGVWVWGDGTNTWLRGVLQDVDGERFLIDWTGSGGISWKDEWKFLEFDLEKLTPYFDSPSGTPNPPFTLNSIYLAQQKEADKADSAVILDALTAIYIPENQD